MHVNYSNGLTEVLTPVAEEDVVKKVRELFRQQEDAGAPGQNQIDRIVIFRKNYLTSNKRSATPAKPSAERR